MVPASEVVASEVVIESPKDVLWFGPPPDGAMTVFDVLLAAPDAAGAADGRGFATAAGYETTSEVVTAFNLANGERLWVIAHVEPMASEQVARLEAMKNHIVEVGREAIQRAIADPQPHDIRGAAFGYLGDGTGFYADLAIAKESAGNPAKPQSSAGDQARTNAD